MEEWDSLFAKLIVLGLTIKVAIWNITKRKGLNKKAYKEFTTLTTTNKQPANKGRPPKSRKNSLNEVSPQDSYLKYVSGTF
jgi:hypothetical protein